MKEINVGLENCYGIKKLSKNFDFSAKSTYAIYAPNGIMKTSLAKTFLDLSNGAESQDSIFTERETKVSVLPSPSFKSAVECVDLEHAKNPKTHPGGDVRSH